MRNKLNPRKLWLCLILGLISITSCQDKLDDYYEVPGWLKGNAREVLASKGNFNTFLKAIDKAGFADMISGRGIVTVVAPTDEAFSKWLSQNNYGSIDDVPSDELKKMILYHLVYYSFNKQQFANYQPYGNSSTDTVSIGGMYYKFRTKSRDEISSLNDHTTPPNEPVVERKIYHKDRFLPVLSSFIFNTKGIDAASNYEYFYPQSKWTGENGGFNISNASVSEYAIIADNGYIYAVDEVIDPLETVYTELSKMENYSVFLKMYDRFADFYLDAAATADYGNGEDLYVYKHIDLPSIALEWTYNGENTAIPDYANMPVLSYKSFNVFAPSNTSLQKFFNSFWKSHYSSMDEVPFLAVKYLLDNHVYEGSIVFPEEITKGLITTKYNTAISFDPQKTDLRKICENGTLYGLQDLMVPRMFQSVTAPLFQDSLYIPMMQMMHDVNVIPTLMADNNDFALFIPVRKLLIENSTVGGNKLFYVNSNRNKFGYQQILVETDAGTGPISLNRERELVNNHIGTTLMSTIGKYKIYKTMNSYQYLLVYDNKEIYSSNIYNNYKSNPGQLKKLYDAYNGVTYEVRGTSDNDNDTKALFPDENNFTTYIQSSYIEDDFKGFASLASLVGFFTQKPPFNFLIDKYIAFIPAYDVVEAGKVSGAIPSDRNLLTEYLKYYFVNVSTSTLTDYPFAGTGINQSAFTFHTKNGIDYSKLTIMDAGDRLQVKDAKGNVVNVKGIFPNIYKDGAVYIIDGLLDFE
ncbi:MAG: fasciclin domain-containing protein [Dysgonomonas sp.]